MPTGRSGTADPSSGLEQTGRDKPVPEVETVVVPRTFAPVQIAPSSSSDDHVVPPSRPEQFPVDLHVVRTSVSRQRHGGGIDVLEAQGRARQCNLAVAVMGDFGKRAALEEVGVVHDVGKRLHRCAGYLRCCWQTWNTSALERVDVHASTTASVASMFWARVTLSAKRGSSASSGLPMASSKASQWRSRTQIIATWPSLAA